MFKTNSEWEELCKMEANCHHNDGWTMEYYRNELKKIQNKKKKKKETQSSTCFSEKAFWEV